MNGVPTIAASVKEWDRRIEKPSAEPLRLNQANIFESGSAFTEMNVHGIRAIYTTYQRYSDLSKHHSDLVASTKNDRSSHKITQMLKTLKDANQTSGEFTNLSQKILDDAGRWAAAVECMYLIVSSKQGASQTVPSMETRSAARAAEDRAISSVADSATDPLTEEFSGLDVGDLTATTEDDLSGLSFPYRR